jgi:hypothetical protein
MPGIDVTADGYVFSQSWLGTYFNCPEQARLEMVGEMPRIESDATAMGSACHSGIELVLGGGTISDGLAACHAKFEELEALPEFNWVQVKTRDTAQRMITKLFTSWVDHILPQLPAVDAVELKFQLPLGPRMWLKGAIDCVDEHGTVWDWKTAGRPYEPWEKERWAIQPTAYTQAVANLGTYEPRDNWEFTYAVMLKSGRDPVQLVNVTRHQGHWDWLAKQCQSIVALIEADLPVWPLRDQHVLCSAKFCSVWAQCKGAFV